MSLTWNKLRLHEHIWQVDSNDRLMQMALLFAGLYDELSQQGCYNSMTNQGDIPRPLGDYDDNDECSRECTRLQYPVSATRVGI